MKFGWVFRYADGTRHGTYSAADAKRLIEADSRLENSAVRIVKFKEVRGKREVVEVIKDVTKN